MRASLNPTLEIHGVVLTMHDSRTKLADEVSTEVRSFFGEKVYSTVIPRNVRVAEAPSHGKPILLYDYRVPAAAPISNSRRKSSTGTQGDSGLARHPVSSPRKRGPVPRSVRGLLDPRFRGDDENS